MDGQTKHRIYLAYGCYPQSNETRNEQFPGSGWRANGAKGKHTPLLVPLLIEDLVFSKALVLASIGTLDDKTQYYFLSEGLLRRKRHWLAGEESISS
jgi:hypothetical protein